MTPLRPYNATSRCDPGAGSGPPLASLSVAHACHLAAEAGAPDAHALGARSRGLMTRL